MVFIPNEDMKRNIGKHILPVSVVVGAIFLLFIGLLVFRVIKKPASSDTVSSLSKENIQEITATQDSALALAPTQVLSLFDMYKRDKDPKIANSLLQYYIAVGNYTSGYMLLEAMEELGQLDSVYKPTIAFVVFNYVIDNGIRWEEVDYNRWHVDEDSKSFYNALTYLIRTDFTGFTAKLPELEQSNVLYKNIISTMISSLKTFSTLKDPPPYYKQGLIAATLMEAGYMPLAGLLATNILRTDRKYILSYEILSQKALKQREYSDAIKYLLILFGLDSQHISRTAFYLGKAYYRQKDYSNALVYLNQVSDRQYLYDAIRYMILTYHEQHNIERMMDGFRYLLTEKKLSSQDYLLLYDIVFFEPYTNKNTITTGAMVTGSVAHEYALKVIIPYIDSCRKNIAKSAAYVCKYGEAGRYLSQNKPDKALKDLLYLTKTYPHPTVFKALGDYYTMQGDNEKAQNYYIKGLVTSADTYQNTSIFSGNSTPK